MSYREYMPDDLRKYVRNTRIKKLICFILTETILGIVLFIFGDKIFFGSFGYDEFDTVKYILYTAVMVIPALLLIFKYRIFDKTYWGEVGHVAVKTEYISPFKARLTAGEFYNIVYLTIILPNRNIIKRKVSSDKIEFKSNVEKFKKGDNVFHLCGTKLIIVIPSKNRDDIKCVVCGASNNSSSNTCNECGHTLVKEIPRY